MVIVGVAMVVTAAASVAAVVVVVHCKKKVSDFPAREGLVSDILGRDGKIGNLLLQCWRRRW